MSNFQQKGKGTMTTMNLPGFSAEISLDRSNAHYQQTGWDYAFQVSGEVVPQQVCECNPYYCCCNDNGRQYCFLVS